MNDASTDDDADLAFMPAVQQAEQIGAGTLTAQQLAETYRRRIARFNRVLGAYLWVADTVSTDQANMTVELGALDRPLAGVTVSVKDLTATTDMPTSYGLVGHAGHRTGSDDHVAAQLRRHGLTMLGKTTTPALGLGCVSEPAGFLPARNPWDTGLSAGGSSGGAAAAVSAGLCAVAHGSDGGGSIRIPAAWCGVVGLKPSRGRVSAAPSVSSLTGTSGPLGRSVSDVAALLDVMSGATLGDAFAAPAPTRPFVSELRTPPDALAIGVALGTGDLHDDLAAAVDLVAAHATRLGHRVVALEPEPNWDVMITPYLEATLGPIVRQAVAALPGCAPSDPLICAAMDCPRVDADTYAAAQAQILTRARRAAESFADIDVLLTPTVARYPPAVGAHRELDVYDLFATWESYVPYTTMWNWTGQPALSLPVGLGASRMLPVAVQLVGRPNGEATILRLAAQLETELGWVARPTVPAVTADGDRAGAAPTGQSEDEGMRR